MKENMLQFSILLFVKFNYYDILGKAAEISYYLLFSLFPLLLLLISLLPFLSIDPTIITSHTSKIFPTDVKFLINNLITYLLNSPSTSAISFGAIFTLYSASGATNAILKNLNRIYEKNVTKNFIKYRLISLAITLFSLLIVFSYLILNTIDLNFIKLFFGTTIFTILLNLKWLLLPILVFILIYIFYFLSNNYKYSFSSIMPGVFFFMISFFLSSKLFTLYLTHFGKYNIKYGALSSIIILLLWLFIIAFLILFGGLLNSTIIDWQKLKSKSSNSFEKQYNKLLCNFK